ncbi:unnamed protein product, partial [Didymodactylos carnosus]
LHDRWRDTAISSEQKRRLNIDLNDNPLDQEMDIGTKNDCVFKVGDVFNSFNEFKYKLNDYSTNTGGMFSICHPTKLKQTSELVYGKHLYICCHGDKQRCRSKGIRPQ